MRGWVTTLIILGLISAGCIGDGGSGADAGAPSDATADSGPDEPGAPGDTAPDAASSLLGPVSVVDCRLNPFAFSVEGEKVRAQVPSPYAATSSTVGSLGLEVYECSSVVLNNETVLHDVSFAWTIIPVEPPEEWQGPPGAVHVFMTEFFVPAPLADLLSNSQIPATVGTVTTVETEGVEATVEVEGELLYEAVGYGRSNQEVSHTGPTRLHLEMADGFGWIDDNATLALASLGDTVHLTATGGTLQDVSPAAGHLFGRSTPGSYSSEWTFGGPDDLAQDTDDSAIPFTTSQAQTNTRTG